MNGELQAILILPEHEVWLKVEVAQLCPTLCDLKNSSMPGLPVRHQLPEFTQIHIYGVSDAIQPSNSIMIHLSLLLFSCSVESDSL